MNSNILELVKKEVIIEYWEQAGTKRRQAWLYYKHKPQLGKGKYWYSECVEYKEGKDPQEEINKRIEKIASEVERQHPAPKTYEDQFLEKAGIKRDKDGTPDIVGHVIGNYHKVLDKAHEYNKAVDNWEAGDKAIKERRKNKKHDK